MATPAEIVVAIDTAILQIVQDGARVVEVNGQRYESTDLDMLRRLRTEYEAIAARTTASGRLRGPVIQVLR